MDPQRAFLPRPCAATSGGYEARYADLNRNFFCFSLRFLPLRFLEDAQNSPGKYVP